MRLTFVTTNLCSCVLTTGIAVVAWTKTRGTFNAEWNGRSLEEVGCVCCPDPSIAPSIDSTSMPTLTPTALPSPSPTPTLTPSPPLRQLHHKHSCQPLLRLRKRLLFLLPDSPPRDLLLRLHKFLRHYNRLLIRPYRHRLIRHRYPASGPTYAAGGHCRLGLSGTIPSINLAYLGVDSNQLTGRIPSELGRLTALTTLSFSDNQLTGRIPEELGRLSRLTELLVAQNLLSGSIPPQLDLLTTLNKLWMLDNDLSGSIPANLCDVVSPFMDCGEIVCETCCQDSNQNDCAMPSSAPSMAPISALRSGAIGPMKLGAVSLFLKTEWMCQDLSPLRLDWPARNGNLEMLQWLRVRGWLWDARTLEEAEQSGHSEVAQWARSNGCPSASPTVFPQSKTGVWPQMDWFFRDFTSYLK